MKPRHEPNYDIDAFPDEFFAGYIEEFDLYISKDAESETPVTLVGDVKGVSGHNYDCFNIENGRLVDYDFDPRDLHITPYHMCLLYAACIEHGLIEEQDSEAEA